MKLSQWHKVSVKPVHVGVYERINIVYLGKYSYWDGKIWTAGFSDNIISIINHSKKYESFNQNLQWRGIVKDEPICRCGNICVLYGGIGGYSVSCKSCNEKNAKRQRIARAKK